MVYAYKARNKHKVVCKVTKCDRISQGIGVCQLHRHWVDFSKPDENIPKYHCVNRKNAKYLCKQESVELLALLCCNPQNHFGIILLAVFVSLS